LNKKANKEGLSSDERQQLVRVERQIAENQVKWHQITEANEMLLDHTKRTFLHEVGDKNFAYKYPSIAKYLKKKMDSE